MLPNGGHELRVECLDRTIFNVEACGAGVTAATKKLRNLIDSELGVFGPKTAFERTGTVFDHDTDINSSNGSGVINEPFGIVDSRASGFIHTVFDQTHTYAASESRKFCSSLILEKLSHS